MLRAFRSAQVDALCACFFRSYTSSAAAIAYFDKVFDFYAQNNDFFGG